MNKIAIAIIAVLFAGFTYSQETRVLNLSEALNIAKKNNPDYVIAKLDKLKAEKKVSEVYSENLIPTLTLSSRYARSFMKQTINIFGQNYEIGSDNSITTAIDVSEPIPILGTPVFNGIKIAEYYERIQDENLKKAETNIKADVKKAFYTSLLLKKVIELNEQRLENSRENLRVVEARYNGGIALEYDVLRARVSDGTIETELLSSRNQLIVANNNLKFVIGLKDDSRVDVTGNIIYDSSEVWGTTDELIRKISEENVNIRQLKLNKLIYEQLAEVDYANYLPKLYLFGQYLLQANENDSKSIASYRFFNAVTAGIGLSWDLNVFRNSYREDQSLIEVRKTEEQISKFKELLKTQTHSVLVKIEDAKSRIRSQRELLSSAERGFELANISYKNGVLNQIDVLNANLGMTQVKLMYITAVYDYLIARTELEQLLEK
jgi:outer membrane protein